MKRVSLKKEIGDILEGALAYQCIKDTRGDKVVLYRAEMLGGNNYTIGLHRGETLDEAVEAMKKKAERMFRKKSEKMDGGLERQKHMAALIRNSHLLQDLADIRYQHLTNGYSIEKAMRLVFDYKRVLPEGVTCIQRHLGRGEFVNVYGIPEINVHAAMEILPILPPKYLRNLEM